MVTILFPDHILLSHAKKFWLFNLKESIAHPENQNMSQFVASFRFIHVTTETCKTKSSLDKVFSMLPKFDIVIFLHRPKVKVI